LTVGADNTSTTFGGNISDLTANYSSAVGSVTKVGTGVLTLSGSNTYKGGTFVTAGGLTLASGTAFPTSGLLNISAGTIVQIAAHTGSSSYVPVIGSLSNSGTIDITDNAMVIHNSSIGTIWPQIAAAYNGGAWNGTNTSIGVITSSAAAADTTHLTAVGVATGLTTFQGMNVSTGDVLVKDTYYGDANLDGQVTSADYTLIDAGYLSGGTLAGWQNGDFNYDGVINGSDYTLIDNAFNTQGAILAVEIASATSQIASISPAAVPEPSTLCLFAAGTLSVLGRRRRR
jgi:autotransporter-associated beta strand protein